MLESHEAIEFLESEGITINRDQISQLARNGAFPGANKDDRGRWQIPTEDLRDAK